MVKIDFLMIFILLFILSMQLFKNASWTKRYMLVGSGFSIPITGLLASHQISNTYTSYYDIPFITTSSLFTGLVIVPIWPVIPLGILWVFYKNL